MDMVVDKEGTPVGGRDGKVFDVWNNPRQEVSHGGLRKSHMKYEFRAITFCLLCSVLRHSPEVQKAQEKALAVS